MTFAQFSRVVRTTAEKVVKAQNVVDRVLKQQTTQKIAP